MRRRSNRLPLGNAALAGTAYPLDREHGARTLGMVDERMQRSIHIRINGIAEYRLTAETINAGVRR